MMKAAGDVPLWRGGGGGGSSLVNGASVKNEEVQSGLLLRDYYTGVPQENSSSSLYAPIA